MEQTSTIKLPNFESVLSKEMHQPLQSMTYKVRVATMTHDHYDTPHAILTLLVVPSGK